MEKNNYYCTEIKINHNKMLFPVPVHISSPCRDIWEHPSSKTSPKKRIK